MKRISLLTLPFIAAAFFAACGGTAENNYPPASKTNTANANAAAKPVAAAPTKDALVALEKSGWEAWKNKDAKFWDGYLSDKYVGFGPSGRLDKAAEIKLLSDAKIDVKSYSFSDEKMEMLGSDVAVLTFRASQDYTVDGKPGPKDVWSSSIYVREGDKWKSLSYVENPVVDPNAKPAKPAAPAPVKKDEAAKPTESKPDTFGDALMAIETKGWAAWKQRDRAGEEAVMAKDFMYMSGLGRKEKEDALKLWIDSKCTGLDYKFSDPMGFSVTPDVSLVTYKADVKGTCDGKPNTPAVWVASFDIKEGDTWKNAFYTDVPR